MKKKKFTRLWGLEIIFALEKIKWLWTTLVNYSWMPNHVLFEMSGLSTWVTASSALIGFFSCVNSDVGFQISCLAEWAPAVMWLLSTMGEQMCFKVLFCDWRVFTPFACVWFFTRMNTEVSFQSFCMSEWPPALFAVMWFLSTVGEQMFGKMWLLGCRVVAPFTLIWLF